MTTELLPCPFCGEHLRENKNQRDFYVARYGTHFMHSSSDCFLTDEEVTPSRVEDWNTRATTPAKDAQAVAEPTDLAQLSRALIAKLDAVGPHLTSLHVMAQNRGMHYTGPTYGEELEALRAALASSGKGAGE